MPLVGGLTAASQRSQVAIGHWSHFSVAKSFRLHEGGRIASPQTDTRHHIRA